MKIPCYRQTSAPDPFTVKMHQHATEIFKKALDAYHFFEKFDDLIKTGPTHTNVMDIRVILIG